MRRCLFLFFLMMFFLSCQPDKVIFEQIDCDENAEIANDNLRKIFKPCRVFIYRARYWDVGYEPISDELIQVDVPGNAWEHQPERQDEIVIQYQYDPEEIVRLRPYSLNEGTDSWVKKTTTGIIETENEFWMHPFRHNQYDFTEVAPFPKIMFPITLGKRWTSTLNIGEGWGVWANSSVRSTYEVVAQEEVELPFGNLQAWQILSRGSAQYGTSQHNFWFHEEYGFVKMTVKNYKGQLLQFKLIEVQDR